MDVGDYTYSLTKSEEGAMKLNSLAAVAVLAVLTVALSIPAEAAKRNRQPVYYDASGRQVAIGGKPPTRFTVRPRSYLNPGTETKQYDQHYADYAFPPGGSISYQNRNNYDHTWTRNPLSDPFDIPGWPKF